MPSHLQEFAHQLVERHGPMPASHIWHAFTNLGNFLPGASPAEQIAAVEKELGKDDRFDVGSEAAGREGRVIGFKS